MNRAMPTFQKSYDINLLLERKLKACQHFLAATRRLKSALAAEEMTEAMHLIQDREKLIYVIGVLDNLINPEEISDLMGRREDLFQDLRLILERIATENRDCERIGADRRTELRDELSRLRQQGQGIREYAASGERPPKFLDLKS